MPAQTFAPPTEIVVKLHRAQAPTSQPDDAVPLVKIIIDTSLNESPGWAEARADPARTLRNPREHALTHLAKAEASKLYDALVAALPQATLHQLLIVQLERTANYMVVPRR